MFCGHCGSPVSDNAKFCPNCGMKRQVRNPPSCPTCGAKVNEGDSFCEQCGSPLGQKAVPVQQQVIQQPAQQAMQQQMAPMQQVVQQPVQQAVPMQQPIQQAMTARPMGQTPALTIPANVVPKTKTGKRVILTNRPFTHDELLRFMQERWDVANYNYIMTDPSLKKWTDLYVVLPATQRHMVIVYSRDSGSMFSKENKIVVSFIPNPAGAAEMMIRAIPTSNVFFGAAKIAGNMNEKQDREGPTDDAMQRYADYLHYLLQQAGYLQGQ